MAEATLIAMQESHERRQEESRTRERVRDEKGARRDGVGVVND